MDETVIKSLGCNSVNDYDCLCSKEGSQFQTLIKSCVIQECGLSIAVSLPQRASELCACVASSSAPVAVVREEL
jgi:hypothetical protein